MSWGDSPHLEIFGGVTGQFQYLSGQVFENGSTIYGGRGTNPVSLWNALFEESVDSSDWELWAWVSDVVMGEICAYLKSSSYRA